MLNSTQAKLEKQDSTQLLEIILYRLIEPLLRNMNEQTDRRLVKTLLGLVMAILMHRHRNHGLLLNELGGYLMGPECCRAGTKRISNLLRSEKWDAEMIERFLLQRGTQWVGNSSYWGDAAGVMG